MKASGIYLFHEEQSFRQSWIIFLVLIIGCGVSVLQLYGMYQQLYLHKPWGDHPLTDTGLILVSVSIIFLILLVTLLFLNLTLVTEVREDGFYFRFPVFLNKWRKLAKEDISNFEVVKYNPIIDFGGWGIRYGKRGKAYNVKGNMGLKLYFSKGRMILFGTQQPLELEAAMKKMMDSSNF